MWIPMNIIFILLTSENARIDATVSKPQTMEIIGGETLRNYFCTKRK